jgi:hypothetical protein
VSIAWKALAAARPSLLFDGLKVQRDWIVFRFFKRKRLTLTFNTLWFDSGIDEMYDIRVLPHVRRASISGVHPREISANAWFPRH